MQSPNTKPTSKPNSLIPFYPIQYPFNPACYHKTKSTNPVNQNIIEIPQTIPAPQILTLYPEFTIPSWTLVSPFPKLTS